MLGMEDPPSLFGPWGPANLKSDLHQGCQHKLFSEDQVSKLGCELHDNLNWLCDQCNLPPVLILAVSFLGDIFYSNIW